MKADAIRFRCTKKQRESFEEQAKAMGLSLSAWIINKCNPETPVATDKNPMQVVATKPVKPFVCLLKNK